MLGDEYDFFLFFLYMSFLLFPSAKTSDPLYPFREFSGERSLQVVLNAVMEIFVKFILLQVQQATWNGRILLDLH